MAVSNQILMIFLNNKPKGLASGSAELIFQAVSLSTDGTDQGVTITSTGTHFDFNAKNITNVGTVDGRDVSADGTALDNHLADAAGKHNADQIAVEDAGTRFTATDVEGVLAEVYDDVQTRALDADVIKKDGSVAFTAAQSMGGFKLTNVATPTAGTDAANKDYVDAVQQGLDVKQSVRALSDSNVALSGGATLSIDGVSLANGDRVLLVGQTDATQNGIYVVSGIGSAYALTRSTDADADAEVTAGMFTFVTEGTTYADTGWVLATNDAIVVDTTELSFIQFSSAGQITAGDGLTKTGQDLSVNVDDSTIEIVTDTLQVKDSGISTAKIADAAVDENKLASSVAGDGLSGGAGSALAVDYAETFTNSSGVAISAGDAVVIESDGSISLADADTANLNDRELGIALEGIADSASGRVMVRPGGIVGGYTGLTRGEVFVSATPGAPSNTAPSASGQSVYRVGYAISATQVRFMPEPRIELI